MAMVIGEELCDSLVDPGKDDKELARCKQAGDHRKLVVRQRKSHYEQDVVG
jgi:hypothetical protein